MGTAAYMAPEQASGKPVDRRADIWAFGALLDEMLAGVRPFPGETVSDTLAAGTDVGTRLDAVARRNATIDQDTPRAVSGQGSATEAPVHRRGAYRVVCGAGTAWSPRCETGGPSSAGCGDGRRRSRPRRPGRGGIDVDEKRFVGRPGSSIENST